LKKEKEKKRKDKEERKRKGLYNLEKVFSYKKKEDLEREEREEKEDEILEAEQSFLKKDGLTPLEMFIMKREQVMQNFSVTATENYVPVIDKRKKLEITTMCKIEQLETVDIFYLAGFSFLFIIEKLISMILFTHLMFLKLGLLIGILLFIKCQILKKWVS
jgi:hypothetical protein